MSNLREIVKKIIPAPLMRWRRQRIAAREQEKFAAKSVADTFTEIYRKNLWGGSSGEFFSGRGSRGVYAQNYAGAIRNFIGENQIRSVVDLGCGDFQVASMFVDESFQYTGCDVVAELVEHLGRTFGSDTVKFKCVNIVTDELPPGDLCLIRQVLQHLSNAEIKQILGKCGQFRYLIVTEHYPAPALELTPNLDIPHGPEMRLHYNSAVALDKPPFDLKNVELLTETVAEDDTLIKTFVIKM
jgi:SAM-dependent methyltransferase